MARLFMVLIAIMVVQGAAWKRHAHLCVAHAAQPEDAAACIRELVSPKPKHGTFLSWCNSIGAFLRPALHTETQTIHLFMGHMPHTSHPPSQSSYGPMPALTRKQFISFFHPLN